MAEDTTCAVLLRRESDDVLSAEGWAVYSAIRREVPAAYVDLAQLGFCSPVPGDDPGHHRLKADALAAMWRTYQDAGMRVVVVSGRVDERDVERYALAMAGTTLLTFQRPTAEDAPAIAKEVREHLG
jgi:hypothetical protein